MDSSFTVLAVGIEIALYKVASINLLTQVCQDKFANPELNSLCFFTV